MVKNPPAMFSKMQINEQSEQFSVIEVSVFHSKKIIFISKALLILSHTTESWGKSAESSHSNLIRIEDVASHCNEEDVSVAIAIRDMKPTYYEIYFAHASCDGLQTFSQRLADLKGYRWIDADFISQISAPQNGWEEADTSDTDDSILINGFRINTKGQWVSLETYTFLQP